MPFCGDLLEASKKVECELIEALVAIGPKSDDTLATDGFSIFVGNHVGKKAPLH